MKLFKQLTRTVNCFDKLLPCYLTSSPSSINLLVVESSLLPLTIVVPSNRRDVAQRLQATCNHLQLQCCTTDTRTVHFCLARGGQTFPGGLLQALEHPQLIRNTDSNNRSGIPDQWVQTVDKSKKNNSLTTKKTSPMVARPMYNNQSFVIGKT